MKPGTHVRLQFLLRWAMNRKMSGHFLAVEQPKGLKLNNSFLFECWALSQVKLWTDEILSLYWIPSAGLGLDKLNFWVLAFSCPIFQVGIFGGSIYHNKWDGANKYSSTYSMGYTLVPGLRSDTIWIQGSIGSCQQDRQQQTTHCQLACWWP